MSIQIVHIGYHKTATTWFQQNFYPKVSNCVFVPRRVARRALLEPSAFRFEPGRARKRLGVADDDSFIICEENLSGYIHNGGLHGFLSKEVAYRLRETTPDAQVVVFLRSQPEMIAATYQQYVRGGGTHRPQRYLFPRSVGGAPKYSYKVPRFSFEYFEYHRLLAHYRNVFGADRLHVFLYEEFRSDPAKFAASYSRRFGLDIDLDALSFLRVNTSYSRPVLEIARVLNRFTERSVEDKHYIADVRRWYRRRSRILERLSRVRLLSGRVSPSSLLGEQTVEWIRQYYCKSNTRLVRDFGLPLDAYGYPLTAPATPVPEPTTKRARP